MATTTTFKLLLEQLVEETSTGDVLPGVTGTTTGITLADAYAKGPFPNQRYARGSAILTTAGTAINEATFVDQYTASTGVFTIEPDASGTFTACIISPFKIGIDHPDRFKEAINRALTKRCCRWQKVPLTFVPDGDLLGVTTGDFWTESAGTDSYVEGGHPEVTGRVLQISHSSTATLTGNTIPAVAGEVWEFETAIRATTDGDTATFVWRDVTNGADITSTYQQGTGTTTSRAFITQRGQFTVPGTAGTDARIAPRLTVSGSGTMTAQMSQIVAYPRNARTFPLQKRVETMDNVGNLCYSMTGNNPAGSENRFYTPPITLGGRAYSVSEAGDHYNITLNFTPCGPVYYDELVYGTSLSAMTDTTTFPANHVMIAAKYELYKWLYDRDEKWKMKVYEAKKTLDRFHLRHLQEPTVVGRV